VPQADGDAPADRIASVDSASPTPEIPRAMSDYSTEAQRLDWAHARCLLHTSRHVSRGADDLIYGRFKVLAPA
jgi:hypothetical protein